ncbi:hypothetical protein [Streptomyces sp. NPDC000410]|uniref:hypothetical protein n=1 Tax=Streptomyces sp. NPDC000410 TaxID=3154254 RepID=UPI003325E6F3
MIKIKFSVRAEQGDPSGFDLGDIACIGDLGESSSEGRTPDQGMMIYLSVTLLLDNLAQFLNSRARTLHFTGTDTSFGLTFQRDKTGTFSISSGNNLLARASKREITEAVLLAAEELAATKLLQLSGSDAARSDYSAALHEFRALAERSD